MRQLAACVLVVIASAPASRARQDDTGFVPLFNGHDLHGWVSVTCAPNTWSVVDAIIHTTGKPICELRTERMYENFILELDYKHLVAGGNSGVFIWGDAMTARGEPFVRAIEVQVLDGQNTANYTSHGDVFAIHGAKLTPDRPHPAGWMRSLPSERRARPAGEWNHYRITARDGTIKLAVNGKEVSGGYDITPRRGYIHLESEGGEVLFRNLRIKELPSAGALSAADVAQQDEGFVSHYNGLDFSGWDYPRGHEGHWVSKDWTLAYDGRSDAPDKDLWTADSFGDVTVIADWRRPTAADDTVLPIRIAGFELSAEARDTVARALSRTSGSEPPWHRAVLTKRNGQLSLAIDGAAVLQDVAVPAAAARGRIGLRHDGKPIEFTNIFIKDLNRK